MEHVVQGLEPDFNPESAGRWAERPSTPALTAAQAACIEALRQGAASHNQIAATAGLTRYKTWSALLSLESMHLIEHAPGNRWQLTRRGKAGRFRTVSDRSGGGAGKLGRAARRALRALDRPMSAIELAARLDVTRRQAAQLIGDLHAAGRIRLGEPRYRLRMFARVDDPTPLLTGGEERVLAAAPADYATTAERIEAASRCGEGEIDGTLARLLELGLIAAEATAGGQQVYRVTELGAAHPQYRRTTGQAAPPSLPVRSDRACAVLALLAERGQAQIPEVRDALEVARTSINALFQYLKRKALVRRDETAAGSPYVLTERGREVLAEMQRRRAA
jgi:Mn-dependent DtxR family transcriptional regulator